MRLNDWSSLVTTQAPMPDTLNLNYFAPVSISSINENAVASVIS